MKWRWTWWFHALNVIIVWLLWIHCYMWIGASSDEHHDKEQQIWVKINHVNSFEREFIILGNYYIVMCSYYCAVSNVCGNFFLFLSFSNTLFGWKFEKYIYRNSGSRNGMKVNWIALSVTECLFLVSRF